MITCTHLTKTFEQGEEIITGLDDVSLRIDKGEFICISGPSGSGKTTLLNAIGGLDTPDSGTVHIGDVQIDNLDKGDLADIRLERIGFVFQAFNLIPVLTARENIEFVMQVRGVDADERTKLTDDILAEVGLSGMEDRLPSQLSGGQQQRVAVARAIVGRPQLVLADEPTANLDTATSDTLMELFTELNEHHGVTFIISTHDERVMQYAKRLIRMQDGRIISDEKR